MLSLHAAQPRRKPGQESRVGLAVAGGGPIGGMYELGALRALDDALDGLDLTRLDCYVGVSSGAFLAAGLANRIDTAQMCRIFITGDSDDIVFRPQDFMRPAVFEYLRRAAAVPKLTLDWWRSLLPHGDARDPHWSDLLARFGGLVPTGVFDNRPIERFLREAFERRGRSNDFRRLESTLYVVAVDLDSGQAVRFGDKGWDDVPISRAVQASAALPGLYPPVEMLDKSGRVRHFVDGALRRTLNASALLERGVDLMLGINPLVPFNPAGPDTDDVERRLAQGGLPAVLSQTFRTLLQSRMQVGLARHAQQYQRIDQLVFEPNAHDGELFFANAFGFAARRRVCELAYRNTLSDLRARREVLAPVLASHGIGLRAEVIDDPDRGLADGLATPAPRSTDTTARLRRALDQAEHDLAGRSVARRPPTRRKGAAPLR